MPAAKLFGEPSRLIQMYSIANMRIYFEITKGMVVKIPPFLFNDKIFLCEISLILDVSFSLKLPNIPLFLYHLVYF